MPDETAVDKTLTWFKNNKYFAVVIVVAVAISATSHVVDSIDDLFRKGIGLFSHKADTLATRADATPADAAPSFATPVLTFGGKGVGPGLFTDPRAIAVDNHGNIYVAEFGGTGRIQRFDSTGHFLNEWRVPGENPSVSGLAADRRGNVYVAADSLIEYRGETGQRVATLAYQSSKSPVPEGVAVGPDGSLVTAWSFGVSDIVFFDAAGHRTKAIKDAIKAHEPDADISHVAVDGSGIVYAIDHYGSSVFKFSPNGDYVSRFGTDGMEPGQFHLLLAIAVDGKGRVFAADIKGIQMFDPDGRFIKALETPKWVMGLAFDDSGALFSVSGETVTKFKISQ